VPIKNVGGLVSAFHDLRSDRARLVVGGAPSSNALAMGLRELACSDARVTLVIGDIVDDELQVFLVASDRVVLPSTDILNSATAVLALSFLRPVLVSSGGVVTGSAMPLAAGGFGRTRTAPLTSPTEAA
jgi:beta-1,4-mannosyltransferase